MILALAALILIFVLKIAAFLFISLLAFCYLAFLSILALSAYAFMTGKTIGSMPVGALACISILPFAIFAAALLIRLMA